MDIRELQTGYVQQPESPFEVRLAVIRRDADGESVFSTSAEGDLATVTNALNRAIEQAEDTILADEGVEIEEAGSGPELVQ